jgi:hypothetical protein
MTYYWTLKLNDAAARRADKLAEQNVQVDTSTHEGRKLVGYSYLERVKA